MNHFEIPAFRVIALASSRLTDWFNDPLNSLWAGRKCGDQIIASQLPPGVELTNRKDFPMRGRFEITGKESKIKLIGRVFVCPVETEQEPCKTAVFFLNDLKC